MTFSFLPRIVCKTKSKISGEIVVKEQFGQYKLYVQGTLQSGGIVKNIWKKPLEKIRNSKFEIRNSLILGLGGGTVVRLIKKRWPEAKITSIEIDPEIIRIGKKYFGLGEMKNLRTIQADAIKAINNQLRRSRESSISGSGQLTINNFDLIIIDLYLGKEFPKKAESKKFLENAKRLLSKNGLAIFNRLRSPKENSSRGSNLIRFEEKLKNHFSSVERIKTATNLFFLARA